MAYEGQFSYIFRDLSLLLFTTLFTSFLNICTQTNIDAKELISITNIICKNHTPEYIYFIIHGREGPEILSSGHVFVSPRWYFFFLKFWMTRGRQIPPPIDNEQSLSIHFIKLRPKKVPVPRVIYCLYDKVYLYYSFICIKPFLYSYSIIIREASSTMRDAPRVNWCGGLYHYLYQI